MPELVYDENALTLTAYPDTDVDLRAKIILLHGATAAVHHAGAWASGVAPGIWSVGGTADRLARKGFEVFVPEAEEGAGRPGDWLARACAWANKDGGPATVVGFSFGGSSAVLLARHAQDTTTDRQFSSVALGPLYLLDPALRSLAVGAALEGLDWNMQVLFAASYRTRGRGKFASHPRAKVTRVPDTAHRHFAQPLGLPGDLYAVADPGVYRAHRALEQALGV
jgi:hypothetical protein